MIQADISIFKDAGKIIDSVVKELGKYEVNVNAVAIWTNVTSGLLS